MDFNDLLRQLAAISNNALLEVGSFSLSLSSLLYVLSLFILFYYIATRLKVFLVKRLSKSHRYGGNIESVISFFHYALLTLGAVVILQSAGLDLSTLAVIAGAVGLGIGLGLQDVTNNLISGIIILFERPLKVGDRVEVKNIAGQVTRIGMRSTTVVTNDNISIIIPNSDFISSNVINWSHTDEVIRLRIPVGTSYKENPHKVIELLNQALKNTKGLAETRKSDVLLDGFGDHSMNFTLRVWTKEFAKKPGVMRHHVNLAIWDVFHKNGIVIPFKQLDLHLKTPISGEFDLTKSIEH